MSTPAGTDSCVTACPFCRPVRERIIFENPLVIALWDAFPVNRGHALIIARFAPDGINVGQRTRGVSGNPIIRQNSASRSIIPCKTLTISIPPLIDK